MMELKITVPAKMERHHPATCCLLILIVNFGLAASRHCDHHHFWDSRRRACRPCTKCPQNEIIRKPCGRHSDRECGPFREFNFFNQLDELHPAYTSYDYEESALDEDSSGGVHKKTHQFGMSERQSEPIVQKDDGEYWKNLAFALIGVVCVLISVATIVVLVTCRKLHDSASIKRPEEDEDDDSGYVVIRAIRPPNMVHRPPASSSANPSPAAAALLGATQDNRESSQDADHHSSRRDFRLKGTYKPKRRLLNYDADDVFESEDSAGSRTSRKLQAIPERSASSDGDTFSVPASPPV